MPMLRTIDRPTKATLRPCACAASSTCWMRCTWLAKLETMTRRGAVRNTVSMAGTRSPSDIVKPGTSALVESVRNRSTPSSPSRAKPRRSVIRRSSGNWSILKSPVCSTRPASVRIATARPSGIEWLTARNSRSNGPNVQLVALLDLAGDRLDPVLLELGVDERQRQLRPDERDVGALAQQVGHAADVVLVAVGQHDRDDVVEPVPDRGEVGEDHVDARLVLLGEQHAAVDDQQLAGVLEDGHVAADLAEAAQGDHAQAARGERGRGAQFGMGVTHTLNVTAARMRLRPRLRALAACSGRPDDPAAHRGVADDPAPPHQVVDVRVAQPGQPGGDGGQLPRPGLGEGQRVGQRRSRRPPSGCSSRRPGSRPGGSPRPASACGGCAPGGRRRRRRAAGGGASRPGCGPGGRRSRRRCSPGSRCTA